MSSKLIVIAGVLGAQWLAVPMAHAQAQQQDCESVNTTSRQIVVNNTFITEGDIASGLLQGSTRFTTDTQSITRIASAVAPAIQDMTFSYTGDLLITTADGSLLLRGVGVFEGMKFGRGTLFANVTQGTDRFAAATGYLYANFFTDSASNVISSLTGQICFTAPPPGIQPTTPPESGTTPQPVQPPPPGQVLPPPRPRPLLISE